MKPPLGSARPNPGVVGRLTAGTVTGTSGERLRRASATAREGDDPGDDALHGATSSSIDGPCNSMNRIAGRPARVRSSPL